MSIIKTFANILQHPLNTSNKLSAIVRFLKWQLGSRLVPGEVIYTWMNNAKIIARTGETGVTGNIYCGLHEFSDMAFLLHVLRKDDVFVDIGANVGSYTVLASSVIGAKTCCFEPVPSTYTRLLSNIRINDMEDNVIARNIALGNTQGEIYFSSDENCMNHVIADTEKTENTIKVAISTLDDELEDIPFVIKIDVEGYETSVLEGAKITLEDENLCAAIVELNGSGDRYGYDESQIIRMMLDLGFKTYTYQPFEKTLIPLDGSNPSGGNTIFIRNITRITDRLHSASKIQVHGVSI